MHYSVVIPKSIIITPHRLPWDIWSVVRTRLDMRLDWGWQVVSHSCGVQDVYLFSPEPGEQDVIMACLSIVCVCVRTSTVCVRAYVLLCTCLCVRERVCRRTCGCSLSLEFLKENVICQHWLTSSHHQANQLTKYTHAKQAWDTVQWNSLEKWWEMHKINPYG